MNGLLVATGNGVAVADRGDGVWSVTTGLEALDVRCVAAGPSRLYAGTQEHGVHRSLDGGHTWEPAGLDDRPVKALAVSRAEPDVVYAGTKPPRVYRSTDGGDTWTELESFRKAPGHRFWWSPAERPGTGYVQALALSPTDPDLILAGIEVGGVVRSEDGGETWARAKGAIMDCHSLSSHPTSGDHFYQGGAGLRGSAALSTTSARRFTKLRAPVRRWYGWAVAADAVDPELVYWSANTGPRAAHGGGDPEATLFRARGATIEVLARGLPDPIDSMPYAIVTDPVERGSVMVGLSDGRVFESADAGDSWTQADLKLGGVWAAAAITT